MSSPRLSENDIRLIAQSVVREQIDREREFLGTTFRSALWVAGISLTVIATAIAFFGVEKLSDIKKEALDETKIQIREYVRDKVDKDLKDQVRYQYGVALAATLQAQALAGRGGATSVTESQARVLTEIVLNSSDDENSSALALGVLRSAVREGYRPQWWGEAVKQLVASVLDRRNISRSVNDRLAILILLFDGCTLEDWPVLSGLRGLLTDRDVNPAMLIEELMIERKLQPSDPIPLQTLRNLTEAHPGLESLEPQVLPIMILQYPGSAEAKRWWTKPKDRMSEDLLLFEAVASNLMVDADIYASQVGAHRHTATADHTALQASYTFVEYLLRNSDQWDASWTENQLPGFLGYRVSFTLSGRIPDGTFNYSFNVSDRALGTFVSFLLEKNAQGLPKSAEKLADTISWLKGHLSRFVLKMESKPMGVCYLNPDGVRQETLKSLSKFELTTVGPSSHMRPAIIAQSPQDSNGDESNAARAIAFDQLKDCTFVISRRYRNES